MTNIENNQSIIIEGGYLFPKRLKEFDNHYIQYIIPVFMGFSSRYIKENYYTGIIAHRSNIELRGYPEERTVGQIISENENLKLLCKKSSVQYFEIDGEYENDIAKVYQWIDERITSQYG